MRILEQGNLKVKVNRDEVLKKLHENREQHAAIVVEARKGYVEHARKVVEQKLKQLEAGKVVSLSFHLSMPVDYTNVYDTAIQMLSMHKEELLEMDGSQVRCLVMDEWEWTKGFAFANGTYSALAMRWSANKGIKQDEEDGGSAYR